MKWQISFQHKLVLVYSALTILLISLISFGSYYYYAYVFEKNAKATLSDTATKMSWQTDNMVQTMDYISIDLLSHPELISAAVTLYYIDRTAPDDRIILDQNINTINNLIISDSINRTVYRVNIFNRKNDFLTSNDVNYSYKGYSYRYYQKEWLREAADNLGGRTMIPPHTVKLPDGEKFSAFSLIRAINGPNGTVGFLEVQDLTSKLTKIVKPTGNYNVLVINNSGQIVFSSKTFSPKLVRYYSLDVKNTGKKILFKKNPITHAVESLVRVHSGFTGWTVILAQDREVLLAPLALTRNIMILIGVALILGSIAFVYLFSTVLTRPLKRLILYMEEASIYNLSKKVKVEKGTNEIEMLYESFQMMRERLSQAIQDEVKSRSFQLKASLDSLQAQINPHFLYNILNVLSGKGMEDDDEEICEICAKISAMLRYTTDNNNETVTIGDEIEHLNNYLDLMQKRFEHKLHYDIRIEESLNALPIPKLSLQPIVENSLHHGFENQADMAIQVVGFRNADRWQIDVRDNGRGFDEETLDGIKRKMKEFEEEIHGTEGFKGLKIGGMGLVNTYARMSLFYNREFLFELGNNPQGGACISLGGVVQQ